MKLRRRLFGRKPPTDWEMAGRMITVLEALVEFEGVDALMDPAWVQLAA